MLMKLFGKNNILFYHVWFHSDERFCMLDGAPDIMLPVSMTAFKTVM